MKLPVSRRSLVTTSPRWSLLPNITFSGKRMTSFAPLKRIGSLQNALRLHPLHNQSRAKALNALDTMLRKIDEERDRLDCLPNLVCFYLASSFAGKSTDMEVRTTFTTSRASTYIEACNGIVSLSDGAGSKLHVNNALVRF